MSDRQKREIQDRESCLALLRTVRVGRLVFTEHARPAVEPVSFRLHRGQVVVRVAGAARLVTSVSDAFVVFEADEFDPDLQYGWSVTVVGYANLVADAAEIAELSETWLVPRSDGRHDRFIRVRTEKVTGRRLYPPLSPVSGGSAATPLAARKDS